jgi:hypothetical protein
VPQIRDWFLFHNREQLFCCSKILENSLDFAAHIVFQRPALLMMMSLRYYYPLLEAIKEQIKEYPEYNVTLGLLLNTLFLN